MKVPVSNHPGATTEDILGAIKESLKTNPDILIVHTGTSDLTKSFKTLRNIKRICEKVKRFSSVTKIALSNIIYRKDKRNIDKQRIDTNSRLKNFCNQKKYVPIR